MLSIILFAFKHQAMVEIIRLWLPGVLTISTNHTEEGKGSKFTTNSLKILTKIQKVYHPNQLPKTYKN